ncbi:hypothetical protein MMC12_007894 [Toensbergia leucococca]|nr:hypothetical protein [Toensbergia leucococca]
MLSPRELRPMISASQNLPLLQRILPTLLLNTPRLGRRSYAAPTGSLPRVAQPSVWNSIVPKFLRESQNPGLPAKLKRSKDWNPATFYIVIFLLIGSNAIQMIALRHEYTAFSRKADAKIGLLKEVIERIQRGEDVDVAGLLGTGDEVKEKEWEDVLREIEEEDHIWQSNSNRRKKKEAQADNRKIGTESASTPMGDEVNDTTTVVEDVHAQTNEADAQYKTTEKRPRTFY